MASAPQIAANRSKARAPHAPGQRRQCGGARRGIRPRSTAAPRPLREDPAKIVDWESRADLSNEISERDVGGKPIRCSREPLS